MQYFKAVGSPKKQTRGGFGANKTEKNTAMKVLPSSSNFHE